MKAQEDRPVMPHHHAQTHGKLLPGIEVESPGHQDHEHALEKVPHTHRQAELLGGGAPEVAAADLLRAVLAEVDAARPADQVR